MNLSNHLSIVLRGTTSKPSEVAFSFFKNYQTQIAYPIEGRKVVEEVVCNFFGKFFIEIGLLLYQYKGFNVL